MATFAQIPDMASDFHTLLITPPFTQLNTPYPATAYLTGYLRSIGYPTAQADLGMDVILALFTPGRLDQLFDTIAKTQTRLAPNEHRILKLKEAYLSTITPVIQFLQNKNPTLAYTIVERDYLPEASRFEQLDDLEWAFGHLGIQDKARHLATLYLEDLADLIQNTIDPHFGFSRYAERLSLSAVSFDPIYEALSEPLSLVDELMIQELSDLMQRTAPNLVCLSVPFPGNLFGALRCGQYLKKHHPQIKIAMGGGYPNTELRNLQEVRLFEFIDYLTLDDGERPLQVLIDYLCGKIDRDALKRTFVLENQSVRYINGSKNQDVPFSQAGTPDYTGLALTDYLSVIEITNPMHRLWSDGRWNKLTMAHGCYWKKCTFCDISLDYIKNYEPVGAALLCDRMETLIAQTGTTGFHFVDEAAPPALMREVAIEIIKRNLKVTWWTNIRFEKRFTPDLCRLLKASGCIAVSGGLEVASDRLLEKIQKGVTVAQVAQVTDNFTASGIMVHAYLMYGFPTQTDQETIDSLEMVRQLFEQGVIQSGFWHQFAMTAHSPVGLAPADFGAVATDRRLGKFAHNDIPHTDLSGADHEKFSEGLRKSLFNYMHGMCLDFDLQEWFDFDVPYTTVPAHQIEMAMQNNPGSPCSNHTKIVWIHAAPEVSFYTKKQKNKSTERAKIQIETTRDTFEVIFDRAEGEWIHDFLSRCMLSSPEDITFQKLSIDFSHAGLGTVDQLTKSQGWRELRKIGLLLV